MFYAFTTFGWDFSQFLNLVLFLPFFVKPSAANSFTIQNSIAGKTASLIKTSAKLGAMASDSNQESVNFISEWAWHNGIIFQITDDILDLSSDEQTLGKPSGNDILEGTYTLPVLIALKKQPEKIKKILSDVSDEKIILKEVISEFNNDEIISESKLFLKTHIEKSENAAMKIENKDIRNILLDLNRYLIERSN